MIVNLSWLSDVHNALAQLFQYIMSGKWEYFCCHYSIFWVVGLGFLNENYFLTTNLLLDPLLKIIPIEKLRRKKYK